MINIETLFKVADENLCVNTAYPIFKEEFKGYIKNEDIFDKNGDKICFYIHIPFCKQLCKFCEYTKFLAGSIADENRYLSLLNNQIDLFLSSHNYETLCGFDIGGGTPTALSEENFELLLKMQKNVEDRFTLSNDYEKSIEISFSTITDKKLELISQYGFKRISAGIQSISEALMKDLNRYYTTIDKIKEIRDKAKEYGIDKFNIDLMYGLSGQTDDDIKATIKAIKYINPEQVTIYETRFNRTNINHSDITRMTQYNQYKTMYNSLLQIGYRARFGMNTFTKDGSLGVSSYLKHRMEDNIPYKGFGISAQSMSSSGISYGSLKNTNEILLPDIKEIYEEFNYILPKDELIAKYVSIAMYNGCFSLDTISNILGVNSEKYFGRELEFLFKNKYTYLDNNIIYLTVEGYRYYGAICSLFWSDEQKNKLLNSVLKC